MRLFKFFLIAFGMFIIYKSYSIEWQKELHCKHFFAGCPLGGASTNDIIFRDIYALSSNDSTKFADWVCYLVEKSKLKGENTTRSWKKDPWLDSNETLEPDDYKDATELLQTQRGHMAPLASFKGTGMAEETNYLSNITPQKAILNQGAWKDLEYEERRLADSVGIIYVMTGTIFKNSMPKLPNADEPHKLPSAYWKIIIVPEKKSGKFKAAAFIMPQDTPRKADFKSYITTIARIEKLTGFDFLWELDDSIELKVQKNDNKKWIFKVFR